MQIDKLVQLINLELKKDKNISVNKICNKIGEKQSKVKSQLRDNNYSYNADLRQYIQKDNDSITDIIDTKTEPKIDDIQRYNQSIDINKLNELIGMIEPLKAIVEKYNKDITIVEVNTIELKAKAVTEVKQKLFKIDIEVLKKWDKFIADHKEFKVQQLISLALEEFINKYS